MKTAITLITVLLFVHAKSALTCQIKFNPEEGVTRFRHDAQAPYVWYDASKPNVYKTYQGSEVELRARHNHHDGLSAAYYERAIRDSEEDNWSIWQEQTASINSKGTSATWYDDGNQVLGTSADERYEVPVTSDTTTNIFTMATTFTTAAHDKFLEGRNLYEESSHVSITTNLNKQSDLISYVPSDEPNPTKPNGALYETGTRRAWIGDQGDWACYRRSTSSGNYWNHQYFLPKQRN